MQTMTLEIPTEALVPLGLVPPRFFQKFEELELLETLGLDARWRLQILRLRTRAPRDPPRAWVRQGERIRRTYRLERFELLESRPETRDHFFLVRQRNEGPIGALLKQVGGKVFPARPFLLRESITMASFRGEVPALRRVIGFLRSMGIPHRVRRIRRGFRGMSREREGADQLTPLQFRILQEAFHRGYYTIPRHTTLAELGASLDRSAAAVGKILRRAEIALVSQHLREALRLAGASPLPPSPAPAATILPRKSSRPSA